MSALFEDPNRGAIISACERYRYRLWRRWDPKLPSVVWIMLNPSTADADKDDPTIRRCINFAKSWGYGGIQVVNLYPFRTSKPKFLWRACERGFDIAVMGKRNLYMSPTIAKGNLFVAAWGAADVGDEPGTLPVFMNPPMCLGTNKDGSPKHPLYVNGDTKPVLWVRP